MNDKRKRSYPVEVQSVGSRGRQDSFPVLRVPTGWLEALGRVSAPSTSVGVDIVRMVSPSSRGPLC